MRVRALEHRDRPWLRDLVANAWSLPVVTPTGAYEDPSSFDGVVAEIDSSPAGAVTYRTDDAGGWEVVTVNATVPRAGAGTAMMSAVKDAAASAGAARLWLITTDENHGALAFYERLRMRRARTLPDFVEVVARHKPAVRGAFRDAIEFEWPL